MQKLKIDWCKIWSIYDKVTSPDTSHICVPEKYLIESMVNKMIKEQEYKQDLKLFVKDIFCAIVTTEQHISTREYERIKIDSVEQAKLLLQEIEEVSKLAGQS